MVLLFKEIFKYRNQTIEIRPRFSSVCSDFSLRIFLTIPRNKTGDNKRDTRNSAYLLLALLFFKPCKSKKVLKGKAIPLVVICYKFNAITY